MESHHQGLFFLYLSIILLTLNGLFAKIIPLDALSITALRSILAMLTLFIFMLALSRPIQPKNPLQLFSMLVLGLALGGHWVTFFHSMQISSIAIGMLSLYSYPVITVIIEAIILKQKPKGQDFLAGGLVLVGLAIMLGDQWHNLQGDTSLGIFWGILSAFLFSLRNTIQKYYFSNIPSEQLMFYQVIAIALILFFYIDQIQLAQFSTLNWTYLIVLGVVTTAGAHTLLIMALKKLKAKTVAMIGCLQPVFASILAWVFIDETISIYVLVGGCMILSVALYESLNKQN